MKRLKIVLKNHLKFSQWKRILSSRFFYHHDSLIRRLFESISCLIIYILAISSLFWINKLFCAKSWRLTNFSDLDFYSLYLSSSSSHSTFVNSQLVIVVQRIFYEQREGGGEGGKYTTCNKDDKWKSVDNPQSIHKAISIAIYR